MHQFQISPIAGHLDGSPFVFTTSALWMVVVLALIWLFMLGGMKRQLVPGRWQAAVEFASFMVRPFSLAAGLFVAMIAGHILVEVFANFVVQGLNAGGAAGPAISVVSFIFIMGVMALELLVCAIQAYVFALLTSLYI